MVEIERQRGVDRESERVDRVRDRDIESMLCMCNVHCTIVYNVYYTYYIVHCIVQYTLYGVQCTVYTAQRERNRERERER